MALAAWKQLADWHHSHKEWLGFDFHPFLIIWMRFWKSLINYKKGGKAFRSLARTQLINISTTSSVRNYPPRAINPLRSLGINIPELQQPTGWH